MSRETDKVRRSARTRLVSAKAAVRSALRRYPSEILASLRRSDSGHARPLRDLLEELAPEGLAACWLGHASVVVETGGLSFVVDPVLSERIGPRIGKRTVGLSRRTPAPVAVESLKGVDAILITHAHFDHLDRPTLRAMVDARTTVFVPPKCKRLIPPGFREVVELAPGSEHSFRGAAIETTSPRHWGARTLFDRGRGSCAYTIRHNGLSVLFAGDTAETHSFDGMTGIDLAVFGIGAYDPWEHMHATPEQVWQMFNRMDARYLLPVHHSTFELSEEPLDEPVKRLMRVCGEDAQRVILEEQGEVIVLQPEHS